jgi:predicted CoA-binding protein
VNEFLAQKRIAVAGVSRNNSHHPAGNLIYRWLKKTGHEVFAVNPHMQTFEGDRCYGSAIDPWRGRRRGDHYAT